MNGYRVDQLLGELTDAEKKFVPKELYLAGDNLDIVLENLPAFTQSAASAAAF